MKQLMGLLVAGITMLVGMAPISAEPIGCTGSCVVTVTADVQAALSFNVTITELIPDGAGGTSIGPVVSEMTFGDLASNGTFDPDGAGPLTPQPRALNALRAYQVFMGINSQQRPFTITQDVGPLQSGPNLIPDGAFIVTPLSGVGGNPALPLPVNITVGSQGSAVGLGKTLFSSSGGPSNTMAVTYGITDNPTLGATAFIPLDQPSGGYVTTVSYSATAI